MNDKIKSINTKIKVTIFLVFVVFIAVFPFFSSLNNKETIEPIDFQEKITTSRTLDYTLWNEETGISFIVSFDKALSLSNIEAKMLAYEALKDARINYFEKMKKASHDVCRTPVHIVRMIDENINHETSAIHFNFYNIEFNGKQNDLLDYEVKTVYRTSNIHGAKNVKFNLSMNIRANDSSPYGAIRKCFVMYDKIFSTIIVSIEKIEKENNVK